jgi:hypothetical protein
MRIVSIFLPATLVAAPALAQTPAPPPSAIELVLADPATADRVAGAMHGLSKALLNLPVGEVEAAIDGRPATAADKQRTVRDIGRANDPDFERSLDRQIAGSRVALRSGMQAIAKAVPAMTRAISDMSREMEQVLGNLPRPNYPAR